MTKRSYSDSSKVIPEEYLKVFCGKTVAVVGMGYIGSRVFHSLSSLRDTLGNDPISITKTNSHLLEEIPFDYVINCAGNTGNFREELFETVESNILLNTHILKKCEIREALVCLSSTRVYGFTSSPGTAFAEADTSHQDHLTRESLYDNVKKLMECLVINSKSNYRKIIVRLSNVFGDYRKSDLDDTTLLKVMLAHSFSKGELVVKQDIDSTKDYIFIDDAIEGILRAAALSTTSDVYNICSGRNESIRDWGNFLGIKMRSELESPVLHSIVSNKKACDLLGFHARSSLENLRVSDVIRYE